MIKLLVVDDEPGLCALLKRQFASLGFTVLIATNGQEAISLAQKEEPKIVFLDIKMLGMSGLEVLEKKKQMNKKTKVIMVSVLDDEVTRNKAKQLGADAFVSKPFTSEELEELVRVKVSEILAEEEKAAAGPNILIVDDEKSFRSPLKTYLSRFIRCAVFEAESGEKALAIAKDNHMDLILLDIKMPGLSGIDVIKKLHAAPGHVHILVISAWDDKDIVSQALEAGAEDFLHKPSTVNAIGLKVKEALVKIGKFHPLKNSR